MPKYNPQKVERKWQEYWEKHPELTEAIKKSEKPKFYCLDMFPYPSGDGLHMGHVENYTASDIYSRYLRMKGRNVLHPVGWDAFGLPTENYAISIKAHPAEVAQRNIKTFTRQIKSLGFSYDWSREIDSSDPNYYKWTQWFFLFLHKNGLAYRKKAKVNWCESCQTVLANEQAEGGICERCKNQVIQKDMEQWFFRITDFADELIKGLDKIDWPESTKTAQKNWIGRSEGAIIRFEIKLNSKAKPSGLLRLSLRRDNLEVFTTRLDTIYGCTYCVIAPENELISNLKSQISNLNEVEKYIVQAKKKTDLQRTDLAKEKTGVEIKGLKAVNPFTNEAVPIFVADYILSTYGTGAVMAVPAHDERDFEFAKKYKLEIKEVIKNENKISSVEKAAFIDDGILVNSEKYSNLTSEKAREEMARWLEKNNLGERKTTYKLRDWLISRQRYWGAPIPMIFCEKCSWQPVPEKDLPVLLPEVKDYRPKGTSPLGTNPDFVNTTCPECGGEAKRETDTMDTFVCSSWYFFRFADPKNEKEFADEAKIKKWLPVDLYIGGAEHTVLHLLYSRFFTKALHKHGYIDFDEPFKKLRHQGIVLAEDGRKMSKSLENVINPDEIVEKFGADTLRLYEMFMGPLEDSKSWNTKSIIGLKRFLEKVWKLKSMINDQGSTNNKLEILLHKTIKKVTEDIENLRFNTAISAMMILVNEMEKQKNILNSQFSILNSLLAPFAPHIAEELWQQLGHKDSIFLEKWPEYDPKLVKDEEITLIIQINGKLRDQIKAPAGVKEEEAKRLALESKKVIKYMEGKNIQKVIFVKDRLINFVV
ncbi:MAG: leucine--tRNA ligase [Candidatus Moranbacteria bacterium CG06_land_8_20_14_3_00_43_56]|nr:MAG: leucine--tRNA ligase [Candidatus Moranbacteria bacterium CG06_land_8_20_14_3_00_43_56]PIV83473.1 MAG: leucine--tRNA ligase [Candidatus Moranbacteria bacterium CG17_big_fil_post_rev_8_21_14_2_50_44_12]PJA85660.1 MAG: leucine--tRNA ligase [Candidatus Moranbacteria bacterium CG_4_9_14_3_um_filter_44_28]